AASGEQGLAARDAVGVRVFRNRWFRNGAARADLFGQRHGAAVQTEGDDSALVAVAVYRAAFVGGEPAAAAPAGHEGDVLDALDLVGDGRGDDGRAHFKVQELLAA